MPSKADKDPAPKRPQSAKAALTSTVSYEDMIIAQYLDELKKSPPYTKKSHHAPPSPYSQRLPSTQLAMAMAMVNARQKPPRPQSAKTPSTSNGKPKIDPKFIADPEKWDPSTPRESGDTAVQTPSPTDQKKKSRPASAPAGSHPNRRRPLSAYYGGSTGRMRPQSAKSGTSSMYGRSRKIKSLYKRQPETIVVTAFKNGSREAFCKVAASSLKLLLEMCTDKLHLPLAARRVFLCDGREVYDPQDIPRGAEIYVSMGEDYKDPIKCAAFESKSNSGTWTMNGLVIPHTKKRKSKPMMTKRFKSLIDRPTLRILVFKNGRYTDGIEAVADPRKWQLFLDGVSAKLELRSPCRILYDWEGNPVVQITQNWDGTDKIVVNDIPKLLDPCMQTTATSQVIGPLWASSGEGFSPLAATNYLKSLMKQVKTRMEESTKYKQQLRLAQDGLSEQVNIITINSMTEQEIENALTMCDHDLKDYTNMKQKLKQYLDELKSEMFNEVDEGNSYKLRHIQKLEFENKLVDVRGLRLVVYKNGSFENPVNVFFNITDAKRGIPEDDKQKLLAKLLDTIASQCKHYSEEGEQGMTARKWKLFDKSGREVQSVWDLEQEQEVWFSFGDSYKCPFTFCLQGTFDRVRGFTIVTTTKVPAKKPSVMDHLVMVGEEEEGGENGLLGGEGEGEDGIPTTNLEEEVAVVMEEKQVLIREQLMMDPELLSGKDKSSAWRTSVGPPDGLKFEKPSKMDQELVESTIAMSEISSANHLLTSKDNANFVLYPELSVATKKPKGHTSVWPADAQVWVISKDGYIYMKSMPNLVLTVIETIVKVDLPSTTEVEGYAVSLRKKGEETSQIWQFGADGYITAESQPELALTYLGGVIDDDETIKKPAPEPSILPGHKYFVVVCEKLSRKDGKCQRWALKQERTDNIGQWKHSTVDNPEWNKRALSWPVDRDGEINEKFDWPMEGFLIPYAPPVQNPRKPSQQTTIRLMVLKNGDKDPGSAIPIVGPDLTNMSKDLKRNSQNGKTNKHRRSSKDNKEGQGDSVANEQSLHCSDLSLQQLEFRLFLEHCTAMLNLPFAARRLFDDQGREHFTIRDTLQRDQVVYISCGEPWTDPRLTKAEQQRRFLLANLSADIAQIRQFVALRKPEGFVLEVEGGLTPSARLITNKSAISPDEDKADQSEAAVEVEVKDEEEIAQEEMMQSLLNEKSSAHDRSHQKSERRLENLKWPWERIMEQDDNDDLDEEEKKREEAFTSKELYRKYKPKHPVSPRYPRLHLQKFTYTDGFLACASKPELVLGVTEGEGRASEVTLKKRNVDDIFQRWIISSSGLIKAKHNQKMVLSVTMPTNLRREDQNMTLNYANSSVVLLQHKNTQFGRANQKFMFDHNTGLIHAFYTDFLDKEITAANKANICTFAVIGDTELDQPGYEVEYPMANNQATKLVVCASCARAMRGRFKTQKIIKNVDFACAMGNAQELGIKQVGSFQCLNGKVDLSTFEAEHTLEAWEEQLERLRKERSVRTIAREISQARSPMTVKVAAYLNGEGRTSEAELIFASSIPGLMQQCTDRLHARAAVRRLYTSDGIIILDIDDLIQWGVDHHVLMLKKAKVTELGDDAPAVKEAKTEEEQDEGLVYRGTSRTKHVTFYGSEELTKADAPAIQIPWLLLGPQVESTPDGLNGLTLSTTGATSVESGPEGLNAWVFTGENYAQIHNDDSLNLESESFTIATFLYQDVLKDGPIAEWRGRGPFGTHMWIWQNKLFCNCLAYTGATTHQFHITPPTKKWVFVGTSFNAHTGDLMMWVDDNVMVKNVGTLGPRDMTGDLYVGVRPGSPVHKFTGKLAGLSLFNRAFGQEEIQAIRNQIVVAAKPAVVPKHQEDDETETEEKPEGEGQVVEGEGQENEGQGQTGKTEQDELAELVAVEVEIPPVETILRYPIELWASLGEKFKPSADVNARKERKKKWQEERAAVVQTLETEKHVLRQMQGRRINEGNPGAFKPTNDPDQPVLIEGNWQEPSEQEQQKHDTVHQLQTHLSEVKHTQDSDSLRTCNQATSHRLYGQPQMRRVQVYPNGESLSRAVYVWGESLAQILENATMRLNMRKRGKLLYDVTGKQLSHFSEIERDMLLCVSMGKPYMKPRDIKEDIEIKANWSRARKKYGPRAVDIEVFTNKNPRVDVDPFGPPSLADKAGKKPPRPKSAKKQSSGLDDDTEFIEELQNGQPDEM